MVAAAHLALLVAPLPAQAFNLFYGGDLDQDKAKDKAKDLGNKFKNQGYKTAIGSNIKATDLCDDLKAKFKDEMVDGHFKCEGGVLVVYVSAHGAEANDRNGNAETWIGNPNNAGALKLQDWATWVVGAVPPCCTLVFNFDVCGSNAWWNTNFDAKGEPRAGSPFANVNFVVAAPVLVNNRCIGTPVGDAMDKAFGKPYTAEQYCDFLGSQAGVRTTCGFFDDEHKNRTVITPEPPGWLVPCAGLMLVVGKRKMRRTA